MQELNMDQIYLIRANKNVACFANTDFELNLVSSINKKMDLIDIFSISAKKYLTESNTNPIYPSQKAIDCLQQLNEDLPLDPVSAAEVLSILHETGSPATVKTTSGRYFGFVTGGSLPASMFAKLLATVWDQNAALSVMSPVAATLEEISSRWLISLFGLPENTGVGFVTGATLANFTALAAARHQLLKNTGWDVEAKGLFHAPGITVITGDEVHVSLLKALSMLGLGRERIIRVPADEQGRMIAEKIPSTKGPTIICIQSGNVNTGAFDPAGEICAKHKSANVWIHVDGAFGLWALASQSKKHLGEGINQADSWATDAHKWLNVSYDCGLVFVKNKNALFAAMSATASYLPEISMREPFQYVPDMSREARGIVVWAALKSLGRKGLEQLIERNCRLALKFATALKNAGYSILNDVQLNQVLVSFKDTETTLRIIKKIQEEGTCWCGGTNWQGKTAMRISVSSWATTDEDAELSIAAILKIAEKECN
jgi:glutamate/tyrosine decarboxylase-like PLP-dependent enzyme